MKIPIYCVNCKCKTNSEIVNQIFNFNSLVNVLRHNKTGFLHMQNKDADQLCGNREADQRLCFRYIDSTISLLPKSEISSL